jgi:hypothetical protein
MGKPFGEASRRTFGRIGTLVPFPCWNSLGVMSSDTLKFSKQPPSEALKGGLPVPAHRSACLRRSGFAQAGVSARRRVRFATVRFIQGVKDGHKNRAGFRAGIGTTSKADLSGNHGRMQIPFGQVIIWRDPSVLNPVIQSVFIGTKEILCMDMGSALLADH